MEEIQDLKIYLERMDAALLDKCWWIDKISDDVDTVVDFGCATGNLQKMIALLTGDRYKYVGIDNSAEMRAAYSAKGNVYASLDEALPEIDPGRCVLVLNSVIHEIFTYMPREADALFDKMLSAGFRNIAIRDMSENITDSVTADEETANAFIRAFEVSAYSGRWKEFTAVCNNRSGFSSAVLRVKEFLLKYWYTENWPRECREQYLWDWKSVFSKAAEYSVVYENDFYIPFVRSKIHSDFGICYDAKTHSKLMLERRGEKE